MILDALDALIPARSAGTLEENQYRVGITGEYYEQHGFNWDDRSRNTLANLQSCPQGHTLAFAQGNDVPSEVSAVREDEGGRESRERNG